MAEKPVKDQKTFIENVNKAHEGKHNGKRIVFNFTKRKR